MVSTTVDEQTGEEKKRLINRMRWKGCGPASIMFSDANVCRRFHPPSGYRRLISNSQVPDKPPQVVEEARDEIDEIILKKLKEVRAYSSFLH